MKNKRDKYNGSGSHKRAILHMIGQSQEVFKEKPKVSDIASWMGVSKPTAMKHLKRMENNGEIITSKKPYRPNATIIEVSLTDDVTQDYCDRRLLNDYRIYAQRVMKVILQNE